MLQRRSDHQCLAHSDLVPRQVIPLLKLVGRRVPNCGDAAECVATPHGVELRFAARRFRFASLRLGFREQRTLLGALLDCSVVANRHAMGRSVDEETRTIAALRRRGIVVKVLSHGARHLADAEPVA